jgi:hypothetical protein
MFATVGPSGAVRLPFGLNSFDCPRSRGSGHVLVFDDDRLGHALEKQDRLAVAADTRRVGLDDTERKRHGNPRIDDVAALRQHQRARRRRQRMPRRDDAARRLERRFDQRLLGHHPIDHVLSGCGVPDARHLRPVLLTQGVPHSRGRPGRVVRDFSVCQT